MIDAIIRDYVSERVSSLSWVDKYAGVTYRAEKRDVVDLDGQQVSVVTAAYPVSCDVDGRACWEAGRYADLTPNSAKKSVLYWEAPDGMRLAKREGRLWQFEGMARLVVWLNLKKLGIADCSAPPTYMLSAIKAATMALQNAPDGGLAGANISVDFVSHIPRRLDLFAQYTYADYQHLLMYPNDFFALDFKVTAFLDIACIPDPDALTGITC